MERIIEIFLPFVFNSRGSNSNATRNSKEYASSYGRFKPVYFVLPRRPLSDEEAQRLYNHVRTMAWYLDAIPYFTQAGLPFRLGLDDIISAIPIYGDLVGVLLAMYQVFLSWIFGVPEKTLWKMILNVVIDFVIGIVPILGDILDALFKSNLRNLALLEDWLLKHPNDWSIQITPNDEFLPRKRTAKAANGFYSRNSTTQSKDEYRTKSKQTPRTRRFDRDAMEPEDLNFD